MLGKGGMGEVYEAYDTGKDRVVALKLLAEELAQDPAYQVRFRRESQAAAKLAEPHVIPIHDWGVIDGVLFIDMRLVPGTDLRTVLHRGGPLSPDRAVAVVEQIAAALDAAHAGGLVHRDVKPANILVTPADFAYLADFGIAHTEGDSAVTQVGMAMGSYIYMAPERFDVGPVSHRADIYSLACVLHECLTGGSPFPAASMSVLIRAHLSEAPPRPSTLIHGLPPGLDDVIARGMAKDPADRYATAGDLAVAARDVLNSAIQHARPGAFAPGRAPGSTGSGPVPMGTPSGAVPFGSREQGPGAQSGGVPLGSRDRGAGAQSGAVPRGADERGPGGVPLGAGGARSGPVGYAADPGAATFGAAAAARRGGTTGGNQMSGGDASGTGGARDPRDRGAEGSGAGRGGSEAARAVPGSSTGPARTGKGAGREAEGEGAEPAPTPTGEFRVVGAVAATGGIETSRSQSTATGAQPTLIIRPPDARAGGADTTGFRRVPAEGTGEVSIPAVIQPTGPAEIRPADTHFTPLPPADGAATPEAPEPPPAYTPDQGLPRMRPFPDAHLFDGAPGDTPPPGAPPFPPPNPGGPHQNPGRPAAPTERYVGEPFQPGTPESPAEPRLPGAPGPRGDRSPAGPPPGAQRPTGEHPLPGPGGLPGRPGGPSAAGAPATQRYSGEYPQAGGPGVPSRPGGPGDAAPATQRFPGDRPPFGGPTQGPPSGAPATQRYSGEHPLPGPAGPPPPFGGSAPDPRFGAPTEHFDRAPFGSDESGERGFGDGRETPFGPGGEDRAPHFGTPTQKFPGDPSADRFGDFRDEAGDPRFGPSTPGDDPQRYAATQHYSGAPDAFSPPTEQYDPAGDDPQRHAATRHFGGGPDAFSPPTEQYDPALDGQRFDDDPQRSQPTHQYRGGAAPFPAHQAASGYDDPAGAAETRQYAGEATYSQYDDPQQAYGDHAYREPGYDPGYGPDPHWQGEERAPRRSLLLPVLVGVFAVIVLAIGGAIGWRLMAAGDTADTTTAAPTSLAPGGSGNPAATTPRATTAAPTTSAGPVTLPAGAQPCESGAGGGAFGKAAVGNSVTSCPFAEAVRQAYAAGGTGARSVVAASPVTGRTYTMTCAPEGKLVTCTGGENAVVYVY
ncbi:protein kinase [Nocardia sp. NPDC056064]|uniref:serine/threonine-protein kinase n=1 Tax=Nocardia sp. NPDC056064 TaxID=3345701 RepID=UPI0035D84EE7